MTTRKKRPTYYCGMCDATFTSKLEYSQHTLNHKENVPTTLACSVCNWPFDDSLALESHKIASGHGTPRYSCEFCGEKFVSLRGQNDHMRPPGCSKAAALASQSSLPHQPIHRASPTESSSGEWCDRCAKTFRTHKEYVHHRSFKANTSCSDHNNKTSPKERPGYVDPGKPKDAVSRLLGYGDTSEEGEIDTDSDTPTNMSDSKVWCRQCKTAFISMAHYNAHFLRCQAKTDTMNAPIVPLVSMPSVTSKASEFRQASRSPVKQQPPKAQVLAPKRPQQQQQQLPARPPAPAQATNLSPTPSISPAGTFPCNIQGCQKVSKSEAGLKVHKQDAHGIGAKALDLHGKDSWMLNQRTRENLKQEGLLRPPPIGPRGGGAAGRGGRGRGGPPTQRLLRPAARPSPQAPTATPSSQAPSARPPPQAPVYTSTTHPAIPAFGGPLPAHSRPMAAAPVPTSLNMGGAYEMEQAKYIQGKTLRLLIQSDIFIHHDGKMTVCGIDWTRIGVQKQPEVAGMFDKMCHLPRMLQEGEFVPPPKAFASEYQVEYPVSEFMPPPPLDRSRPGLGVVVIACSKVLLQNGRQEVVKVAAIDLITCRILMNHLVCTDPKAPVVNWRSTETGLFSWSDMEHRRKLGFKVFKGWSAVRKALFKVR